MQNFLRGMGCVGLLMGILVSFSVIEFLLMIRAHEQARKEIHDTLPAVFPILVLSKEQAHIVWGDQLEIFKTAHPDYSFLVPPGEEAALRTQVETHIRANQSPPNFDWNSDLPWSATFKIEGYSNGRQQLRVEATFDDDRMNIGWYEATEKEFWPRYHTFYFGPGYVFATFPLALLFTAALWIVVGIVWRVNFSRNKLFTILSIVPRNTDG